MVILNFYLKSLLFFRFFFGIKDSLIIPLKDKGVIKDMPSNEAIELLENVLSSVNESERWQYRHADLQNKKREDLDKEIEKERKKVEYYGKDSSKLDDLESKKRKVPYVKDNELKEYRTGTKYDRKLNPKDDWHRDDKLTAHNRGVELKNSETSYNPFVDRSYFNNNEPEHKAMHNRINKRTKAFDTTAKHEAAMILIEALNTLLNE